MNYQKTELNTNTAQEQPQNVRIISNLLPSYRKLSMIIQSVLEEHKYQGSLNIINEKTVNNAIYTNYKLKPQFGQSWTIKTALAFSEENIRISAEQFVNEQIAHHQIYNEDCILIDRAIENTGETLLILIIPWRKGTNIYKFIERLRNITSLKRRLGVAFTFLEKIFNRYSFLETRHARHRDLNPGNILISNYMDMNTHIDFDVDFIDFGTSELTTDGLEDFRNKFIIPRIFKPILYQTARIESLIGDLAAMGFNILIVLSHLNLMIPIHPDSLEEIIKKEFYGMYIHDNTAYVNFIIRLKELYKFHLLKNAEIFDEEFGEITSAEERVIYDLTIFAYKLLLPHLSGMDSIEKCIESVANIYMDFLSNK